MLDLVGERKSRVIILAGNKETSYLEWRQSGSDFSPSRYRSGRCGRGHKGWTDVSWVMNRYGKGVT